MQQAATAAMAMAAAPVCWASVTRSLSLLATATAIETATPLAPVLAASRVHTQSFCTTTMRIQPPLRSALHSALNRG